VKSVMQEMDEMRLAVGEMEALAAMLLLFFDSSDWSGADSQLVDRTGHVLGVLAESATSAAGKFERFQIAYVDSRPVSTLVERWTDDGTAPGPGEDVPALFDQDAEIVSRIRARCPDNRYEGTSDEELSQLFKRNQKVLGRSDVDVIAAMTHPR
jgi:hypothetical protein